MERAAHSPPLHTDARRNPNPARLTFLGNAGWDITDGSTVILVDPYLSGASRPDGDNPIRVPDATRIDEHVPAADYVLVTHGHADHALDAPYIARTKGAVIIGNQTVANIARAYDVPDSNLITVRGGEDYEFGSFSLRVVPSLHSALRNKRYDNTPLAGYAPLVLPTHCCNTVTDPGALEFATEVKAASPNSRVASPRLFEPMSVPVR